MNVACFQSGMADDALLRELQRRAAGTGSVEDRAALLRELMRLGRVVKGWFLVPEGEFARRYGLGLAALRAEAKVEALVGLHPSVKEDARPLTFRETLEARRDQFVANKGRTPNDLFSSFLDTCTAIAYKADSTKFKLIFQSDALLSIGVDFNRAIISDFDYEAIRVGPGVVELDVTDGVYNVPLSFADVLKHPGWLAVVEGDRVLLKSYAKIVFDLVGSSAM